MEPLVSVIIPVYNVLPYLREALDSVINQTYKNLEILVVDDGSTDGSGEVCDEYLSDPRVIVIHQENKGLSGARNTGLDRMTGEYVAFLDSDDAFTPDMIMHMINTIIQSKASIAICGFMACYTEKHMNSHGIQKAEVIRFDNQKKLSIDAALNLLIANKLSWSVWNKLYKSTVWKDIRFPEESNYEDMQIMCQVFEKCSHFVTVEGIHVYYRQRPGSITQSHTLKNLQDRILAIHSIENYIEKHTPDILLPENIYLFREGYARTLSSLYATLIKHPLADEIMMELKNKILHLWIHLEGKTHQLQSHVTRILFLHAPILIPYAQSCWRYAKRIFRKTLA